MQSLKFDPGFGKKHGWIGVLFFVSRPMLEHHW